MGKQCSAVASVIIPCFNAERWVAAAIESCLDQTYQPVEIVVVDDGSTDGSQAVIRSYGNRVRLDTGPNRGGSQARNRGFQLSCGDYIQFLDADDYLLPDKIEQQVAFLEQSGADVVYGNWRHRFQGSDGSSYLGEIQISGQQADVLESLLAGWWVASSALLYRRKAVAEGGGWDVTLEAAQDRAFLIAVAVSGADIRYQPRVTSVYRRYGKVTVSTQSRSRWLENHRRVLEKAQASLAEAGRLVPRYREALAISYFSLARNYYDLDRSTYHKLLERVLALHPGFQPNESQFYNSAWRLLGFAGADRLSSYKRRLSSRAIAAWGLVTRNGATDV